MKTLADIPVHEWPLEVDRTTRNGVVLPICTCGRVRSPASMMIITRSGISGRVRRSRMTPDRREYAEQTARARIREPEFRPQVACASCVGAMLRETGITRSEFDRRMENL